MGQSTSCRDRGLSTSKPDPFEVQRAIRRSGLSYAAQALLCAILDHDRYGQSRRGCTASLATLAGDIGATPQYVSQLLPDLVKAGWVVAESRRGNIRPLRMGKSPTTVGNPAASPQGSLGPVPKDCTQEFPRIVGSKRDQESDEGTGERPAAVEPAGHLPAMERFFSRLIPPAATNPR
jgi:hypothetical protein